MPCTYYSAGEEDAILAEELDAATRAACEAFKFIDYLLDGHGQPGDHAFHISTKSLAWWKEHKERDEKRKAAKRAERQRVKAREKAKSKLTPEERKLLGL